MSKRFLSIAAASLVLLSACSAARPEFDDSAYQIPDDSDAIEVLLIDVSDDVDQVAVAASQPEDNATGEGDPGTINAAPRSDKEPDGAEPEPFDDRPDGFVVDDDGTVVPEADNTVSQYGSLPLLDDLYDSCKSGNFSSCDALYFSSPAGSDYEALAITCGDRVLEQYGTCEGDLGSGTDSDPGATAVEIDEVPVLAIDDVTFGDDPALDALWTTCDRGDLAACDELFFAAPFGSGYEDFGTTCGGTRGATNGGCAAGTATEGDDTGSEFGSTSTATGDDRGDHSGFDALWNACAGGEHDACDDLWGMSPSGSGYEAFGDTCGNTNSGASGTCSGVFNTDSGADSGSTGYGDDPGLDAVYDACSTNGDEACDLLFDMSPIDSVYETFALTCGDRREVGFGSCSV